MVHCRSAVPPTRSTTGGRSFRCRHSSSSPSSLLFLVVVAIILVGLTTPSTVASPASSATASLAASDAVSGQCRRAAFVSSSSSFGNCGVERIQRPRDRPRRHVPEKDIQQRWRARIDGGCAGGPLFMGRKSKSGGMLIESGEEYMDVVFQQQSSTSSEERTSVDDRPVMVFFTAPWCGPCRLSIPVVKDIMKMYANKVNVVEVDTDDLPDVASEMGVVSIPTIHLYHHGQLVDTIVGCVAKSVLASSIDKVLEDIGTAPEQEGTAATKTKTAENGSKGEQPKQQ